MPRKKKIIVNTPQKEKYVPKEEEFVAKEEDSLKQFGQKIREARIAKNLSLESVSGHLHIPVKILEAIEEGDAEKCPKPVFLRGLVRTYCHYIGIDKNDVVDKIEKHLKSDATGKQELKTLKPVFEIKESHPIRNIVVLL
ncbi:helix-turn-helix domain-containing protein, partial [bacterium]|nr:helix-turn-helix domain-containing protein [bacterium]